MGATLVVGVLLTSATAFLFAAVGTRTMRRRTGPETRLANAAFALWWFAAAAVVASLGLPNLLGLLGVMDRGVHVAILYARALPLAIALGALMYYFVFLLTGARRALPVVGAAYAGFYAYTIWMYASMGPWTPTVSTWDVRLLPQSGSWTDPAAGIFGLMMCAPMLLAGVGYLSLALQHQDALVRYRIVLVAGGVVLWFAILVLSFALGWPAAEWFPLLYQPAGLAAGVMSLLAFAPPSWVSARLVATRPAAPPPASR